MEKSGYRPDRQAEPMAEPRRLSPEKLDDIAKLLTGGRAAWPA